MNRTPVQSSNIRSVGYDSGSQTMQVEFSSGGVYDYSGVPADVHAKMISAKSIGGAFASEVRGKFEHKKVGGEAAK